ncbi:MAG: hybrid sensor histidine kinase/response regulator [Pedosphaera sp.]|nr:hybrid sensor histidine kinase/response regulator [Pedosphaera sp.]
MSSISPDVSGEAAQKHVLVVDDDVDLAQTYRELLEVYDYRASVACNGIQALKFVAETEVDAIVCDLSMPQMEGDVFYEEARRVRPELSLRFIFVTGNSGNSRFEPFLAKVACPVLYKPVAVDKLMDALANVLGRPM